MPSTKIVARSPGSSTGSPVRENERTAPSATVLLQLRRDYEDKLEKEKEAIKKREEELEERARFYAQSEHTKAEMEKTKELTKLRMKQAQKLLEHDGMHRAAEKEKMATAARAVQLAAAQREALHRTKVETKAEADAIAAERLKLAEERHQEQSRMLEERLNAAAQRRLDDMLEQKRRETVRADKLLQERDAARAEAKAARTYAERVLKDKEEALRVQATQALREKNAAIQMEKDKAETARRTAAQAEQVRAAQVNLRSQECDEITALATQAIKVAEKEKRQAEESWKLAEEQREKHRTAAAEAEYSREEARIEFDAAKRLIRETNEKLEKMRNTMEVQKAALDAVEKNASAEKLALLKAAEEAKMAALMQSAEEVNREKALVAAQREKVKASAMLAKQLGVSSYASASTLDDSAPPPLDAPGAVDVSDARSAAPAAGAAPPSAPVPVVDHAKIDALTAELSAATAKIEEEEQVAAAAEARAAELQASLSQVQGELKKAAAEHKKSMSAAESKYRDDLARLELELTKAVEEKRTALERLRSAYANRVDVAPMSREDVDFAMNLAASAVPPEMIAEAEDALIPKASIGVIVGTRVSAAMAATAGLGATGKSTEVLSVTLSGRNDPFDTADSSKPATSGVAVKVGAEQWLIKWAIDPPRDDSDLDDSCFGKQSLTIATAKEGLVLARGKVNVQPRPEAVQPASRYPFEQAEAATTKVQAAIRGKTQRNVMKKEAEKKEAAAKIGAGARGRITRKQNQQAKQDKAATRLQAAQRGRSGRLAKLDAIMDSRGWGGVFIIATRKPLICRESWELASKRVGEVGRDTRVVVCDTHTFDEGTPRVPVTRALIRLEDAPKPLGWLTASKDGEKSLWAAPPRAPVD